MIASLGAYRTEQWLSAIKLYGPSIMDKSLLSRSEKDALLSEAESRELMVKLWAQVDQTGKA